MAVYRANTILDVSHIKDDNKEEQLLEFIISIELFYLGSLSGKRHLSESQPAGPASTNSPLS